MGFVLCACTVQPTLSTMVHVNQKLTPLSSMTSAMYIDPVITIGSQRSKRYINFEESRRACSERELVSTDSSFLDCSARYYFPISHWTINIYLHNRISLSSKPPSYWAIY
ncbi:uncharacterized protein EDB93DRAFT_223894 [Suillus bovinus]|uniref:uncharacterized protein n=1 Tax=Suillus bovinus TaxID=48563 RepID=UPI001B85CA0D|nr:uncharacterized protein EDB93DRAFT_223894 [Suillus bovinus]KAG2153562.1 hypothetical protein EDB93DRAFT_223894 [Suillus bovinus]